MLKGRNSERMTFESDVALFVSERLLQVLSHQVAHDSAQVMKQGPAEAVHAGLSSSTDACLPGLAMTKLLLERQMAVQ